MESDPQNGEHAIAQLIREYLQANPTQSFPDFTLVPQEKCRAYLVRLFSEITGIGAERFSWPIFLDELLKTQYFKAGPPCWSEQFHLTTHLERAGICTEGNILIILEEERTDVAVQMRLDDLDASWPAFREAEGALLFDTSTGWLAYACQDFPTLGLWKSCLND